MKISYVVYAKVRERDCNLREETQKYWWRSNLPRVVNLNVLTVSSIQPVAHLHKLKTLVLSNTWFSSSGLICSGPLVLL